LTVDIAAEAWGKYCLYEPMYINASVHNLIILKLRKRNGFSLKFELIFKFLP
jgi:hypothetical protein